MASNIYPADFFKRNLSEGNTKRSEKSDVSSSKELSGEEEIEAEFKNEDRPISLLYSSVVEVIKDGNKLVESTVNDAIREIKELLKIGHKRNFQKFGGINFCEPLYCCAYLRRYAVCHTGLVKKVIWKFLSNKSTVSGEILKTDHLTVVSLGGGPGNDLVGFCSALQEIPNCVEKLELRIVDNGKYWETTFYEILFQAARKNGTDFGSFSQCLKKKITSGFMGVDLTADGVFENENLSSLLQEADILLMVKFASFLNGKKVGDLIQNVVDSMKTDAKLIFIDHPYDEEFFRSTETLYPIYSDDLEYKLSFRPSKYHSAAMEKCIAHVEVYGKKKIRKKVKARVNM